VYRGSSGPGFHGLYFFGDFCTDKIWTLDADTLELLERTSDLSPTLTGETIDLIVGFGEDGFGELYVVDLGGEVFRIVTVPEPGVLLSLGSGLMLLGWLDRRRRSAGCVAL
jgi:hypothetical protein